MLDWLFRRRRADGARPVPLVLYTRPGCALCDEMKAEIARARPQVPCAIEEVDIAGDAELERRYGGVVPVLCIAGRPVFEGRLSAAELELALARMAGTET